MRAGRFDWPAKAWATGLTGSETWRRTTSPPSSTTSTRSRTAGRAPRGNISPSASAAVSRRIECTSTPWRRALSSARVARQTPRRSRSITSLAEEALLYGEPAVFPLASHNGASAQGGFGMKLGVLVIAGGLILGTAGAGSVGGGYSREGEQLLGAGPS